MHSEMLSQPIYGLQKIILIDSYGIHRRKINKIAIDDFSSISGQNAVGKTSLLSLIPIFYGKDHSSMVNRASSKYSFIDYYLPSDQSMLVFEYSNGVQVNQATENKVAS